MYKMSFSVENRKMYFSLKNYELMSQPKNRPSKDTFTAMRVEK